MKIIKHILSWFVWGLIALFVGLLVLIHVPKVQFWIGLQTENAISELLGTDVHVRSVDLGFFNRIIIDGVEIKDQEQKQMLRIHRLAAKIDIFDLISGRVNISSAQLFGAHINAYRKDSLSEPNFQFVLDSLASNDTLSDSRLNVRVNSFIMRNSSFTYNQLDAPHQPDVFDSRHMSFKSVSAHIILKMLTEDSLNVNVKRLSFHEHSGLNVENMAMKLEAGRHDALLSQFDVKLPSTHLQLDTIRATYDADHLVETAWVSGGIQESTLAPHDFACFLPALTDALPDVILESHFEGPLSQLRVTKMLVDCGQNDLKLRAQGELGLSAKPITWQLQLQRLSVSGQLLSLLQKTFDLPELLTRIGRVDLQGRSICRDDGRVENTCQLATESGDVNLKLDVATDNHAFMGHLDVKNLSLRRLLDNSELGHLTTTVNVKGTPSAIKVRGKVSHLDFKDYAYHDVNIDGSYSSNEIVGKLSLNDPFVEADLEGFMKKKGGKTAIGLTGFMRKLKPQALHLSDQWGDAVFSGDIDADFIASSLQDVEGTIDLNDFEMIDSLGERYFVDNVHLGSGYDDGEHFLKFKGDMGEGILKGRFDWATLSHSFINHLADKLPELPGLPTKRKRTNNDFTIELYLSDSEAFKKLLDVPLVLHEPFSLQAKIDDINHYVNLRGRMPSFNYNNDEYERGELTVSSPSDSLRCDLTLVKNLGNGRKLDMNLTTMAAENNVNATFWWDNNEQDGKAMSGMLNAIARLYLGVNGKPEAQVRMLPSSLVLAGTEWGIEPCDIIYSAKHLMVDHFLIHHDQQFLLLDGIASDLPADTLSLNLKDVEVAYVLDLVNFHSVDFSGAATGTVSLSNVFGTPKAWADLNVEHFCFENGRMGTLIAKANWNDAEQQIDIHATADDGADAVTYIDGYVSPVRDYIDLDIKGRGTYIDFVQSFTSSFLSGVTGHAYGDVKLVGPLGEMDLLGKLAVEGEATVDALGTTYQLMGDTVMFVTNDILVNRVRLKDRYDNTAYLSGGIHHDHLSDLTFDLDVEAENLLAYDFHDFGENTFYGTVFASGNVDLHGRPGEVVINCHVTPQANTTFTYNVSSADAISQQDFITWRSKSEAQLVAQTDETGFVVPKPVAPSTTDIHINFYVNVTPQACMRLLMDARTGDYITLYGTGNIQATFYDKGSFNMFGVYTVDHGTYGLTIQNIIKKNFTFNEGGTISFSGNPFDASLNLQAVYTVNGVSLSDLNIGNSFSENTIRVNCLMNISGQAGAPRLDFDLDMPTVNSEEKQMIRSVITGQQEMNQQVLYLLGIGRFYTQGSNNANTQQTSQTTLAMQSFLSGTVSTQINEVLSQVVKSNDWNFGANISTGNEGWHNAEYEGLVSGRMLNNRLQINGQFGYRDNATRANPSFIGDFDIRYLLYPNGNLALKVYNMTNDRYFTRSSLNTQGIGLIMKKDFDGLSDLLPFKRKKKSDQKD